MPFRQQLLTTAKVRECTVGATTADGLRWFTAQPCRYPFDGGSCLLVASPPVRDLLNFAKDLFGAAMSWWQLTGALSAILSQADEGGQDKKQ